MSRIQPSPDQIAATRPDQSNWVSANAGSGKTHVLTQRVARLLLQGAEPQKILCLTYTKAAAAEMQTRLFKLLGTWSMLDGDELGAQLGELIGADAPIRNPERLADARRLFARALETPGGLKIQTIHAFCETLLRRFPLEAGISPRFQVADDREAQMLQADIRQNMALDAESGRDDGFDRAAQLLNEDAVADLARSVMARRAPFRAGPVNQALAAHFGDPAHQTPIQIARAALQALDPVALQPLVRALAESEKATPRNLGALLANWIEEMAKGGPPNPLDRAAELTGAFLTKNDTLRKNLATKDVQETRPLAESEIARMGAWAIRTRNALRASALARRTSDLYAFAQPLLAHYETAKTGRGCLDFDDLVARAASLLGDSPMRQWVLYKMDQGIDHILVDEAQDTAPQQWDVIRAIAEEFLSGEGARPSDRSLFVVGDEKQSIYSFQGAQPEAFGKMRDHFASRLSALDRPLGRPALITSYRSAPTILDFVDKVFEGEAGDGLTVDDTTIAHSAHRATDQGRVDLWPLVQREDPPEDEPWWRPVDAQSRTDPKTRLAAMVSDEIVRMIGADRLPARSGKTGRLVRAGDILVLVSRRDQLAAGIIRGLKARGIPVAGSDRLWLGNELAVQDLLALCKIAVLPDDDLSLAALLRSPLCGMSEDELFRLAHPRKGSLWHALRNSEHNDIWSFLRDMAEQADFLRPFEFLEHALEHHDGRRRLLARLGNEAEDAIDELLSQALTYEMADVPTLTGFIAWVETGDIQIKREMDTGGDQVRVMTVHGSKGLEAPIVILPDTKSGPPGGGGRPTLLPAETRGNLPDLIIFPGPKDQDDEVTARARAAESERQAAERKRLLYVALTRAEDWLIICGAEPGRPQDTSWYGMVAAGMERCTGTISFPSPIGEGEALRFQTGPGASIDPADEAPTETVTDLSLPDWFGPARPESPSQRATPSGLLAHRAEGGQGLGRELALEKGNAVHFVLERAGVDWTPDIGRHWLRQKFPELEDSQVQDILSECSRVLAMPDASVLFGPDSLSEVNVAIDHRPDQPRMIGRVDRLVLFPGSILIVDIKTDAQPALGPNTIPAPYLAQLGAYHSAVSAGWPDRRVDLALLWTAVPDLMPVDTDIARAHFQPETQGS